MFFGIFVSALLLGTVVGEGILMVASCNSTKGGGRCVQSPESCKIVGGSIVTPFAETPCGSKEICCYIVPIVSDSDQSCSLCSSLEHPVSGEELKTTKLTTTTTTTSPISSAPDVALPTGDDDTNLVRALAIRDDTAPPAPTNQVRFFARSAEQLFQVPYRIERTFFDKDAIKNTYCWQVALVDSSGKVFGGGALISRNYVITAAHKVANRLPQNFQVVLGKYDFKNQEEESRIASPLEVIIHEKWDPVGFENNIALIRIPNVKCVSGNICTICPTTKTMDPVAAAQDICFVTGWGSTYTKSDLSQLQQNQIRPIKNDECLAGLARSNIQEFVVPSSMFCGSSGDPDRLACDGDGGGPLVCMQSGTWIWELRGLVALGVSQCTNVTDAPTVYVDIGKLSPWITKTVQAISRDKNSMLRSPTTTPLTTTTSTTTIKIQKPPQVLKRRTNDNLMSFSYVFPSFLRHLDDNAASVDTEAQ